MWAPTKALSTQLYGQGCLLESIRHGNAQPAGFFEAERSWWRIIGHERISEVIPDVVFVDGVRQDKPEPSVGVTPAMGKL
jgi:hypothetical protein